MFLWSESLLIISEDDYVLHRLTFSFLTRLAGGVVPASSRAGYIKAHHPSDNVPILKLFIINKENL